MINRRKALVLAVAGMGGLAAGVAGRSGAFGTSGKIASQRLGAIVGNDINLLERWTRWLGRSPDHVLLAFNQSGWEALESSVDFIVDAGKAMMARGVDVQWSIPIAGWGTYEEVSAGQHDALYVRIANAILAATPEKAGRICIRPPWEFNGDFQSQRAKTAQGQWDGALYKAAYRKIAGAFRTRSSRFYFDWCPNIGTEGIDPELCYPGDDLVDVVSVDIYYRARYDEKGQGDGGQSIFNYRQTQQNGLDWLTAFASAHDKLIGISEWGVDDDRATAFMEAMVGWLEGLGPRLAHHNYWDRTDGDADTQLSTGMRPELARIYRQAFSHAD